MKSLRLKAASKGYDVIVGSGALSVLPNQLPVNSTRAIIVSQRSIIDNLNLPELPIPSGLVLIGDGEQHKSLHTINTVCERFASDGMTRGDVVIGIGGGLVTDVAGLCAGLYHRGIQVIHVPTSLVGQVDAAIGGKTAVNLRSGRNLVGLFWQPASVICDLATLDTLPVREWRSGYGEIAKCALIGNSNLRTMSLSDQIYACIELKASAVEADERDEGRRAILNYGHTLAHALEGHWLEKGERGWSHGEAVAVGVVFAARIAHRLGRISSDRVDETISTVRHFGLSTSLPSDVSTRDLFKFMARDKKSNGGYTFILPSNEGMEAVHHIPYEVVEGVLASMPTEDHEP